MHYYWCTFRTVSKSLWYTVILHSAAPVRRGSRCKQVYQKTIILTLRYTHGTDHLITGLTEDCYTTHPDIHTISSQVWQKTVTLTLRYTQGTDHLLTGQVVDCYTHPQIYTWYRPSPHSSDRKLLHSSWDIHIVQTISSQVWQKTVTLTLRYTHSTDHLLTGLTENCYTHPEIYT